jgi:hypothetical protein
MAVKALYNNYRYCFCMELNHTPFSYNRTLLVTILLFNLIYIKLRDCSLQKVNFVYFIIIQTLA